MRTAKVISLIATITMGAGIAWALITGNFSEDGAKILSIPWGVVSLIDLYVGFIIFSLWIVYREKSLPSTILWVVLMMTLGFFTGALYVFIALQKSKGNWKLFWLGKHYTE